PYLNKVAISEEEAFTSGEFIIFRGNDEVDARWLKWRLTAQDFVDFATSLNTGDRPRVKWPQMAVFDLSLPPIDEQRLIVEILEDHLSRIDAGERALRSAVRRGELLELAALGALVPEGTPSVPLKEISLSAGYGTSTKCVVDGSGVPVVRIPNLVNGTIDLSDEKRAEDASVDLSGLMLKEDELLFVRTNGSRDLIGRTAVVQRGVEASFASYLIRYQLNSDRVEAPWVHYMMRRPQARVEIEWLAASSAGQHNLSLTKLDKIQVPLPDLPTQRELIATYESKLDGPRRLVESAGLARRRATLLRRAVLTAAFSGNLTSSTSSINWVEEKVGV
ncbi:MAG: restriction endonuclease subunit S, partial [Yaniella sp.]|nr:restriction endonuclease subunit S [Yaniella sp.]